jgi:uncharacterized protein YndB with AHSA1/START domain
MFESAEKAASAEQFVVQDEPSSLMELSRTVPLGNLSTDLPPLFLPGAKTVARDRWERIVTAHDIDAPPADIWRALTDPASVKQWFFTCQGSLEMVGRDCVLDFDDGDYFLCRPMVVQPPHYLEWRWRWLGIGPAWSVKWHLTPTDYGTKVTVVDEALNPPARTGHYRGEGWPEILDLLGAFVRTGTNYRWPCRSQSYVLSELPVTIYAAWEQLFSDSGLRWWLHGFTGRLAAGDSVNIEMGDATGAVQMVVKEVVPPMYNTFPFVSFSFKRPFWPAEIPGRLFLEPAGWGRSLLQVFQTGWENLGPGLQRKERATIVGFWAEAVKRAMQRCSTPGVPGKASPWVLSEAVGQLENGTGFPKTNDDHND